MTLADWSRRARNLLQSAGFTEDDARQDVAVLARHALGLDQAGWILGQWRALDEATLSTLDALVDRRSRHEPVAYITGQREFYGRPFRVTPAVLIPRPETELLVEVALERLLNRPGTSGERPARVVDIGTGSGCLAVTLALEHEHVTVTATDVSATALQVARANAVRHGVEDQITFREAALAGDLDQDADVIVSNPPYVAEADRDWLEADVRDFEPALALFGGGDGLAVIRSLVPAAWRALVPGGWLVLEIGATQRDAVSAFLDAQGFECIDTRQDLAGHPRVVVARRARTSV